MRIVPVIDLMGGIVVRGVAGRRDEYRAVESRLVASAEPMAVARAFRERLGLTELYLADLDAILDDRPQLPLYRELAADRFTLMVDAGLRDRERAEQVLESGAAAVVAGLETWSDPQSLKDLCEKCGHERVVFSLDLKEGRPLGNAAAWKTDDPFEIAEQAVTAGVRRMIVLDLAGVGVGTGVPTVALCRRLLDHFPNLRLITGGGVRGADDLRTLEPLGLEGVLVASALHDGRLCRTDFQSVRSRQL